MIDDVKSGVTHVSAADLGTNTIKITHALIEAEGSLVELRDAANTIRLGAGIEQTGRIERERLEACLAFLKSEEAAGRELGSGTFIGVATEALRIASNGEELLHRVHSETSWRIEIISGHREAELTYLGLQDQIPTEGDSLIVDIGGGSTEAIVVEHGQVAWQKSMPLGSGRLADRFFLQDPPGLDSIMDAATAANEQLAELVELPGNIDTALFSGGNGVYISDLIHQLFPENALSVHTMERLLQHLATTPAQETAGQLGIARERARVLPAGAAIAFAFLLRVLAHEVVGVPSGIRRGLIREHLLRRDPSPQW
jgi:exopolyphosphatase/guanosine-5'-triphosphate,3'-diphosphate pyrophosphatase